MLLKLLEDNPLTLSFFLLFVLDFNVGCLAFLTAALKACELTHPPSFFLLSQCNSFTADVAAFLTGATIPAWISSESASRGVRALVRSTH